jgi:hypothetical protein
MRRGDICTWFWWGNVRERDHWEDSGVDLNTFAILVEFLGSHPILHVSRIWVAIVRMGVGVGFFVW